MKVNIHRLEGRGRLVGGGGSGGGGGGRIHIGGTGSVRRRAAVLAAGRGTTLKCRLVGESWRRWFGTGIIWYCPKSLILELYRRGTSNQSVTPLEGNTRK